MLFVSMNHWREIKSLLFLRKNNRIDALLFPVFYETKNAIDKR